MKPTRKDARTELRGEPVILLGERAVYWPRQKTLIVADAHWGKAAAFRASAVAVPEATTENDLDRLDRALDRSAAGRLLLLGDLLHAKAGRAAGTFKAISGWRKRHPRLKVMLIRGNHDIRAGDPPDDWKFEAVDEPFDEAPFSFRHYPEAGESGYTLAGHLHPAVRLYDRGRVAERFACFHFGPSVGVLPAFGSFTGTHTVRPRVGDKVFVVADGEVIAVT